MLIKDYQSFNTLIPFNYIMTRPVYNFEEVSLLITHYNRSNSLKRLLTAFKDLNCSFYEIVVSDDGSKPEHLEAIENLKKDFDFNLITAPKNKGLGNNINKGQDAVKAPYTLYIQEDFYPLPAFPEHFIDALGIMEQDKQWDLISFYSYVPYPYLKPYKKGFSEKIFSIYPWYTNYMKFYVYGDHPHIRRSPFFEKFGRYPEGLNGDITEMEMSLSFIKNILKLNQVRPHLEKPGLNIFPVFH